MIIASVITYELAKRIGAKAAELEFSRQCNLVVNEPDELGAARTIRKLRRHAEVAKLHDAGGTSIGHARSRALSVALRAAHDPSTDLDFWVSIDDDVEASDETIAHLVGSIDRDEPHIVIIPCRLRQERSVINITLDRSSPEPRVSRTGAVMRRALFGGFGVVAMSRTAIIELGKLHPELVYFDDDGQRRLGLFCEFIEGGTWYRDDYAFFARVPRRIRIEALCSGETNHAGYKLRLEDVDQFQQITAPDAFVKYWLARESRGAAERSSRT